MNSHNDNLAVPPIQLLIPLCHTIDEPDGSLAWLLGYCLVSLRTVGGAIQLDANICLGARFGENLALIQGLAFALNPRAVLAGYDCHDLVSKLSRLPIEAGDPEPAFDLLATLRAMLSGHDPVDLALDEESLTEVARQYLGLAPGLHQEGRDMPHNDAAEDGSSDESRSRLPHVAADLVDIARSYVGSLAALYFPEKVQPAIITAWDEWELSIQPQLAALLHHHEIGGEPIRIS